jgi:HD-like signal output (HDOD) protein
MDKLWRHSVAAGKLAERISNAENGDVDLVGQAFTAGMLHDIGKLLLAANLPDEFKQALTKARQDRTPLWEAEQSVLGVTHAELGAYLLGIWGLPVPIIEAVALHHLPARFLSKAFCPLTAVHAANALEHEINADNQGLPPARPDLHYLGELELAGRWEHWRALCTEKML